MENENESEKNKDNINDIPIEDNKDNNEDKNLNENNNIITEEKNKNLEDNNLKEETNNNIEEQNNNLKDLDNYKEVQNNNIEDNNNKINNDKNNNTRNENRKNSNIENNININNNETKKIEKKEENQQILLAVQKYFSLLIIEFKEHLQKYNIMFSDIVTNTNNHFEEFSTIIEEYCEEISANQTALYEMISKMTIINDELPQLEELYYKVREIRIGLDKMYKEILKIKNTDLNNKK